MLRSLALTTGNAAAVGGRSGGIGFDFQNILQNVLADLLLLWAKPFGWAMRSR
jgi:small-conductance mechanosensitive channel